MLKGLFKHVVVSILTLEAKFLMRRTKPRIIAITGSVGKTSVKDAIYTVIKDRVYARKSEKSYNSDIGVPLSVLGLPNVWSSPTRWLRNLVAGAIIALHPGKYPTVLVLEVGVDRPGDMDKLAAWVRPDIVVLTRLPDVPVHVEFFATPEAVIEEKRKLVTALKPDGVLIYNQDDEKVRAIAESILQQSIGYSRNSLSPYTASADKIVYEQGRAVGLEFTLTHLDEAHVVRITGSIGSHHAYNYAAAVAVGTVMGIGMEESVRALASHLPPPGRMRLLLGEKDTLIIDDTYNASPVAMEKALHALRDIKGVKRRIAVLGDMMELGQYSVREHEKIGELVATSADALITIGVRSHKIAESAIGRGMPKGAVLKTENAKRAAEALKNIMTPGDIILVKASQSIRAEKVVEAIMLEKDKAKEYLVRQSRAWKGK